MATLDPGRMFLYDNFPGAVSNDLSVPEGGDFGFFNGSRHHNVASAVYRVGEKLRVYNDPGTGAGLGLAGWSTMIYLQAGTVDAGTASVAGHIYALDDQSVAANEAYTVTNDPDNALMASGAALTSGPSCVGISLMTTNYYGWFWCGGVAPLNWLLATATTSLLSGTSILTDGNVVAGTPLIIEDSTAIIRYGVAVDTTTAIPEMVAGLALVADV